MHKLLFLTERSPRHQQIAQRSAPDVLHVTFASHQDRSRIRDAISDCEFLISERAGQIDSTLLSQAAKLRLIQRLGSLTHDIDLQVAQEAGIAVCATPVLGCIMVAEHMLLQLLALAKKAAESTAITRAAGHWRAAQRTDENTFAYNWSGRTGIAGLYQATIGIVGFGEIGVELVHRLKPLRPASLLYHKRSRLPLAVENELGLTYAQPEQIYQQSDFLCCLLPYSKETDRSIGASVFAKMKRGAYLVHCGSGSVLDEPALAEAIQSGQIGGAALDTYEWEPLRRDNPLLALAHTSTFNLLLTPHIAAGTSEFYAKNGVNDFANIKRLLAGTPLADRIV